MSAAVDLVKQGYAAYIQGDVQALLNLADPSVHWVHYGPVPWAGRYSGHDGIVQCLTKIANVIQIEAFEPLRFVADGETVIVTGRTSSTVKATGARFDNHWAQAITLQNGKLVSFEGYDTAVI